MSDTLTTIHNTLIFVCAADGEKLKSEQDAVDLIGEAAYAHTELILIPVERLEEDFFQLKSGIAGQILQKFAMYRRQIVILGDISQYVAQSNALKSFVYEANHGNQVWFVTDLQELDERLKHTQDDPG